MYTLKTRQLTVLAINKVLVIPEEVLDIMPQKSRKIYIILFKKKSIYNN